jgi:NhaP-type Na+/H+ and K+/H+ antiporter
MVTAHIFFPFVVAICIGEFFFFFFFAQCLSGACLLSYLSVGFGFGVDGMGWIAWDGWMG